MPITSNLTLKDSLIIWVISVPCSIFRAWIMTIVWAWFLVPLGLPPVSIPMMFGIGYMWALLNAKMTKEQFEFDNLRDGIIHVTGICVFHPLLILGFAYLVTLFI